MPNNATPFESRPDGAASLIGDKMSDMANQAKEKISDFGTAAANKFDANREAAATGMKEAATSMHENAGRVSGGDKLTSMAHSAATALDCTADWIRENSSTKIMRDVTSMVKQNPGPSMLAAIAFGFLIGRAFSSRDGNH